MPNNIEYHRQVETFLYVRPSCLDHCNPLPALPERRRLFIPVLRQHRKIDDRINDGVDALLLDALEPSEHPERLAYGHLIDECVKLRTVPERLTRLADVVRHADAEEIRVARRCRNIAGQHLESRRLSGTVDAEQTEAFALGNAERQPVDGVEALAVKLVQFLDDERVAESLHRHREDTITFGDDVVVLVSGDVRRNDASDDVVLLVVVVHPASLAARPDVGDHPRYVRRRQLIDDLRSRRQRLRGARAEAGKGARRMTCFDGEEDAGEDDGLDGEKDERTSDARQLPAEIVVRVRGALVSAVSCRDGYTPGR